MEILFLVEKVTRMQIIHPVQHQDLHRIAELSSSFENEQIAHGYRAAWETDLSNIPLDHFWLAIDETGNPIGYAYGQLSDLGESAISAATDTIFDLEDIYILPNHRGRGLGSSLLTRIEADIKSLGYNRIVLYSSIKKLPPLVRFYEAAGFATWYIQMTKEI